MIFTLKKGNKSASYNASASKDAKIEAVKSVCVKRAGKYTLDVERNGNPVGEFVLFDDERRMKPTDQLDYALANAFQTENIYEDD